jgi:NAD(P)-dependent dehydrogenase (short-subunit alcohol dehydrogenase family)
MSLMSSFHPNSVVGIVGASGGIGRALVDSLTSDAHVSEIHAFSRSPVDWNRKKVRGHILDLTDEESIEKAASDAAGTSPLDAVIVASGILHRDGELMPEKTMRDLNSKALAEVFAVNTIGPALIAKHFLPKLRRHHKTVFAALSARVGSIGDNRLGGWPSYRMSKSALNMLIRTLSIEQSRLLPQSIVVTLHPGTVDTPLSKPFSKRVEASKLFSPTLAATQLLQVVNGLEQNDSGRFFAYDGSPIEF